MHKLSKQALDRQADQIEQLLEEHRIQGRISGGTVSPRLIQYNFEPAMGVRISRVARLSEEIAMALGSRNVRINRSGGAIAIQVPRSNPEPVRLLKLCQNLASVPPYTAVLGIDDGGHPLLLRLNAPDVSHVLIAGTTGSGKTAMARTLMMSLAIFNDPQKLRFVLIDPKRRGFYSLAQCPHSIAQVADDVASAIVQLESTIREMEVRDRKGHSEPLWVVAVDELADLIQTGGKSVEKMLARLAQRGREAGLHLVACTQKPTAAMIGSSMKANFPVRLVGSTASKDEARIASGVLDSGAEKLDGKGDFLLIARGESIRFQAGWVGPEDFETFTSSMQETQAYSRR